jgi:hypothetical protein
MQPKRRYDNNVSVKNGEILKWHAMKCSWERLDCSCTL